MYPYNWKNNIPPRYIHCIFLIALLFLTATKIKADNKLKALNDTLNEVIITSRLTQREIIPSQKLKGKDLERLNTQSIADALRYFAGLQVKDYGGVGGVKTVNVRSMGSQHVGIVYDGVMLGNAQNGQIDLGQFSLDNVDEITLYNGQKSSIFQPASDFGNAGSVYIRTRLPRFTNGKNYNLKVKIKYGSSDLFNLSALWEQHLSPAVVTSLNAELLTASGKYKFHHTMIANDGVSTYDTIATRHNGDILAERVEANIHGLISRGFWNFKAYLYNSSRGIPGAIIENVWRSSERLNDLNAFFQGRFQKDITNKFSTQWLAKYAYYKTHYKNDNPNYIAYDNSFWQQEVYFSTANAYELIPNWTISAAYDFRWNKLNANTKNFNYPTRFSHLVSLATAIDLPFLKAQASLLATHIDDDLKALHLLAEPPKPITKFCPALFVNVPIVHTEYAENGISKTNLELRAFAKRNFRMPTFNDLYYIDFGNPKLLPEVATQYDLGTTFSHQWLAAWAKRVHLQLDAYYNTIHNKIIAYPTGKQFRWTMINLGTVRIMGVDVAAGFDMAVPMGKKAQPLLLSVKSQYTYQSALDITSERDSYYKNQIPYVPHHSGSVTLGADYANFILNYSVIVTGSRYSSQNNIPYYYMAAWATHDLNLQYKFSLAKLPCKAILEVNNLFNQRYEVIANYPMPGTSGTIGVQVEL